MNRSRWLTLALLLPVLLLAAGLRLYRLDAQSLWYDEGASLRYAERTPAEIWRNTAADIHPPGYYVALAGWTRLFGFSELALRGMSALFGVLLVGQVYILGRKLFNPTVGLIAAALVAIDPFHVYYGQETRMYTLLSALGAASLWLFLRWLDEDKPAQAWPWLAGLAVVNAAALYTHYIFPFFIGVETLLLLAWWLWETEKPRRMTPLLAWTGLQLVTLALYLPWLPTALRHVTGFPRAQVAFSLSQGIVDMSALLAYGLTLPTDVALGGLIPLGLLALVGLFPPIGADETHLSFGWRISLVLAWLLIPVTAMFVFKLYQGRYLRFILPADMALALLVARGLWMGYVISQPRTIGVSGIWVTLVVVGMAGFGLAPTIDSLSNLYFDPGYARDDYRGIARHLQEVMGPDDAIILTGPNQWEVFTYYYPPAENIYRLPSEDTEAELEEVLTTSERVYAVFFGENERDPQGIVEGTLDARAFEAETRWYGRVRMVTYGVSPEHLEEPAVPLDARFGEGVQLLGYALDTHAAQSGGVLNLTLFWQTGAPLDESYVVFAHLVDDFDAPPLAQHDSVPGGGARFTTSWTPGETVRDNHGLLIPSDLPPGDYTLVVGIYLPESGQRLPVTLDDEPPGDRLPLSSISLD